MEVQQKEQAKMELTTVKRELQKDIKDKEEQINEFQERIKKKERMINKIKMEREEAGIRIFKLETELQTVKKLLEERSRHSAEVEGKNMELEDKNKRLRQEAIKLVQERNDADTIAKDKNFSSNVKSQKIRVLKSQLKNRKKPSRSIAKSQFKGDNEEYLHRVEKGTVKNKSQKVSNKQTKKPKLRAQFMKHTSDSGISDIDEADYEFNQFDAEVLSSRNGERVTLPKIMGRTPNIPTTPTDNDHKSLKKGKESIYKSLANLRDDVLDIDLERLDEDY
jgi:chromosome segregation ATPase